MIGPFPGVDTVTAVGRGVQGQSTEDLRSTISSEQDSRSNGKEIPGRAIKFEKQFAFAAADVSADPPCKSHC